MLDYALPSLAAVLVWWVATAATLALNRRPGGTFPGTLALASFAAAAALGVIVLMRHDTSVGAAYLSFGAAIVIWGWQELSFLTGTVTGPRRQPCPADSRGWRRVRCALETILYHELALLAAGGAVALATWDGANRTALATFALLWLLRASAKLNLFLGVPNTNAELLPQHLGYLATYFARRPMNALFPFSVTAATLLTVWLVQQALAPQAAAGALAAYMLLAALAALGTLEHWLLVLPLPADALWRIPLRSGPGTVSTPRAAKLLR